MKTAEELRSKLSEVFENLEKKDISPKEAAQFANVAGKIISSAKVQIEYYALLKKPPNIPFLK